VCVHGCAVPADWGRGREHATWQRARAGPLPSAHLVPLLRLLRRGVICDVLQHELLERQRRGLLHVPAAHGGRGGHRVGSRGWPHCSPPPPLRLPPAHPTPNHSRRRACRGNTHDLLGCTAAGGNGRRCCLSRVGKRGGGGRLAARWLPARTRCAAPGGRRGRPVHGLVVAPIVAWLAVGVAIAVAVVVAAVAAVGAAKAVVWGVAPAPPGRRVRAVTAARGAAGAGGRRSGCLSRTRAVQAAVQQLPADRRGTAVVGGVGAGTWHPNVLGGLAPMRAARVPCGGGWPAAPAQWRCTH
jgi:hypothetical protein